jgi:hypothetical protein
VVSEANHTPNLYEEKRKVEKGEKMQIETRYNIGESVFVVLHNKIQSCTIKKILTSTDKDIQSISYDVTSSDNNESIIPQYKLFKTIEALIEDMTKGMITINEHDPFKMR